MNMTDILLLRTTLGLLLATSASFAQIAAPVAFEVATIKPSAPLDMAAMRAGKAHIGTKIDAARMDMGSASLLRLICNAYKVKPYQVAGPDWLKTTMYDVQAKIPEGVPVDKVPEMLQALLIERFGLKMHHDSKEQPVYALVVAKGGPKLKESAPDATAEALHSPELQAPEKAKTDSMSFPTAQGDVRLTRGPQGIQLEMPGGEITGKVRLSVNGGGGGVPPRIHLDSSATTMKTFAELLSTGVVDRPVVDMTGLTGRYEIPVDISAEDAMNVARAAMTFLPAGGGGGGDARAAQAGVASDPSGTSVFTSIHNLGLKLEPRKLPLDMLVIDHVEKTPAAN
jgi:uncharacterized protein (TIGR03435 family)